VGETLGVAGKDPDEHPWIDETLVVAESCISGQGLFATESIESGRIVMCLGGRLVSTSELQDLLVGSTDYVDTLTVYEDRHLVLPCGTKVHYGNHSCDPNLWHAGPYDIVARRDIEAGNEVTLDYATQSGAAGFFMACSCAAAACRRAVTSEDWKLSHLQEIYAGHWVPALEERIRRQT
jgi:uncharacterized protein